MKDYRTWMAGLMMMAMMFATGCGSLSEMECIPYNRVACEFSDIELEIWAGDMELTVEFDEPGDHSEYITGTVTDDERTREFRLGIGYVCDTLFNTPDYEGDVEGGLSYREAREGERQSYIYFTAEEDGRQGYLDGAGNYELEISFVDMGYPDGGIDADEEYGIASGDRDVRLSLRVEMNDVEQEHCWGGDS